MQSQEEDHVPPCRGSLDHVETTHTRQRRGPRVTHCVVLVHVGVTSPCRWRASRGPSLFSASSPAPRQAQRQARGGGWGGPHKTPASKSRQVSPPRNPHLAGKMTVRVAMGTRWALPLLCSPGLSPAQFPLWLVSHWRGPSKHLVGTWQQGTGVRAGLPPQLACVLVSVK